MIPIAKPIVSDREISAVTEVLKSGMLAQGEKVKELEGKFAEFIGTKHAVATNSGTAALHACLEAAGIAKGDEVIVPAFTFGASANTVLMQNAKPVFCDIDEKTFNISIESLKEKISPKTKAIMPVHLFGQMADMDAVMEIAGEKIAVVEDAAQAHGSELDGKRAGTYGIANAFSFYATKNMMTGEGGILTTDDENVAESAREFRHHGQSQKRYAYTKLGYNYRMTDITAAIGLCQLEKIDEWNSKRISNAGLLDEKLKGIKGITLPYRKKNASHIFHQYSVLVEDEFGKTRDELAQHLKENGVGCAVYYPTPLHLQPFHQKLGYKEGDFSVAESTAKKILSLPVHPLVSKQDTEKTAETIKSA